MATKKNIKANASQAEAKAQQGQSGVVGSVVENSNLPFHIVEEKVLSGKTKDAVKLIQNLADNGDSNAAYYLAKLYLEKKNGHKHDMYLQMAVGLGNTKALMEFARAGFICAKNEAEREMVFDWFHKAALNGNPEAEKILSSFYFTGYGCEENKVLAGMWGLKARIDGFDEDLVFEILEMDNSMNENDNDYDK